jgi:uncharacterized protein (DUF433 family)
MFNRFLSEAPKTVKHPYPFLEPEDLQQALHYAAAAVDGEQLNVDRVA